LSPLIKGGRGVVRGIKGEGGLLSEANTFYLNYYTIFIIHKSRISPDTSFSLIGR
jgi:hypothetical protein